MVAIDRMDAIRPTAELEQLSSLLGLSAQESTSLDSAHGVQLQKGKIIVNEPDSSFSIMVNGPNNGPFMIKNKID